MEYLTEKKLPGTDPTNVDSDGDGYQDGDEVARGSDPALADSTPAFPSPIAYYDFESKSSSTLDRSFNDNTATVAETLHSLMAVLLTVMHLEQRPKWKAAISVFWNRYQFSN